MTRPELRDARACMCTAQLCRTACHQDDMGTSQLAMLRDSSSTLRRRRWFLNIGNQSHPPRTGSPLRSAAPFPELVPFGTSILLSLGVAGKLFLIVPPNKLQGNRSLPYLTTGEDGYRQTAFPPEQLRLT